MPWKCSSEETVVAEAIDLPTLLWRLRVREVDKMKGSRHLIKASALFAETWIIPDERTYTDLWGSESSRSFGPWSRERAAHINPPCDSPQLAAQRSTSSSLRLTFIKQHVVTPLRPPHHISVYTSSSGNCHLNHLMTTGWMGKCSGTLIPFSLQFMFILIHQIKPFVSKIYQNIMNRFGLKSCAQAALGSGGWFNSGYRITIITCWHFNQLVFRYLCEM